MNIEELAQRGDRTAAGMLKAMEGLPRKPGGVPFLGFSESRWRTAWEDPDPRVRVVTNVRRMLRHVQLGLADLRTSDDREVRELGFYNIAIYGCSLTIAAQNFRTDYREQFDAWYEPRREAMREDPLMRYFYVLRSILLKDVPPPIVRANRTATAEEQCLADAFLETIDHPASALGVCIIPEGGSAWFVQEATDDKPRMVGFDAPEEIAEFYRWVHYLPDPPLMHLGHELAHTHLEHLGELYVEYLGHFVDDLEEWARGLSDQPLELP